MSDVDDGSQLPNSSWGSMSVAIAEPPAMIPAGDVELDALASEQQPPAPRRRRHAAPEDDEVAGAGPIEPDGPADAADELSRGRHGGSGGGVSVAELLARARADGPAPSAPVSSASPAPDEPQSLTDKSLTALKSLTEPVPLAPELAPPKTKAGRNLPAAVVVGLGLGAVIVASLLTYRPSFVVLLGVAAVLGSYELARAIGTVEARAPLAPVLVGGVAMDVAAWQRGPDGLVGALLLTTLGVAVWRLADGASGYRQDVAAGVLLALYVPFLAGFAAMLAHPHDGAARVILFVAAVVCSDTGGYAAGVLFGRHPMAPTVSPNKSWEGFCGSVLASCIGGALIMTLTFHHQWVEGALFGLAMAVVATLGDLGESMIKRDLALKDMGELLPGHGGIMDRLDSILPCAPVAYLLLTLFLDH